MNERKPRVLVTREVFDETIAYLEQHCEVESNQADVPLDPQRLKQRLADKQGLMCALTDKVDAAVLEAAPQLKVVANIAVMSTGQGQPPPYVTYSPLPPLLLLLMTGLYLFALPYAGKWRRRAAPARGGDV